MFSLLIFSQFWINLDKIYQNLIKDVQLNKHMLESKLSWNELKRIFGGQNIFHFMSEIVEDKKPQIDEKSAQKPEKKKRQRTKKTSKADDDIYEVESIIGHRMMDNKLQFLLKWKGYDECTWEFDKNLNCPDLVSQYYLLLKTGAILPQSSQVITSEKQHLTDVSPLSTPEKKRKESKTKNNAEQKKPKEEVSKSSTKEKSQPVTPGKKKNTTLFDFFGNSKSQNEQLSAGLVLPHIKIPENIVEQPSSPISAAAPSTIGKQLAKKPRKMVESILGAKYNDSNELVFVVKYKDYPNTDLVPNKIMRQKHASVLLAYYEDHMQKMDE